MLRILQMRLCKLKATLEEVRSQKAQLEGQLTHAETKVADLREKLEQKEVGSGAFPPFNALRRRHQGSLARRVFCLCAWVG